jgi:hypothetical protein
MLTKADFQQAIADSIANYPAVAALYHAGDPRILQHLDAMAAMLAMLSSSQETAQAEPFEKVRDATVLADAAMRGIIRKARSGRVRVNVANTSGATFSVQAGRNVFDSVGNLYRIDTPATVLDGATGTFDATQIKAETVTHTVSGSVPFYAIEIPESSDDSYLTGIAVSDSDGDYEYRERYVNTLADERVFHVEADDQQRIYVRFGQSGVVATQPTDGTVITLTIYRAVGEIAPSANSPFSFEYIESPLESSVELTLNSLLDKGENPPDMSTLRDLIKYPSVYDHNAVYLGEFEFLVRRAYADTQFLSVWNESVEELVRGADVANINCLFVAVLSSSGTESVLTEPDPNTPVAPTEILEASLTATQKAIRTVITNADDSYKVRFFTPVQSKISMTVTATVSTAYSATDVQSQIIDLLLTEYGQSSPAARRGAAKPLYQKVYSLLRQNVPALADANADWQVSIANYPGTLRPELWRYVAADSLTVTVTTANITGSGWS